MLVNKKEKGQSDSEHIISFLTSTETVLSVIVQGISADSSAFIHFRFEDSKVISAGKLTKHLVFSYNWFLSISIDNENAYEVF